jgi:hypothetical protein
LEGILGKQSRQQSENIFKVKTYKQTEDETVILKLNEKRNITFSVSNILLKRPAIIAADPILLLFGGILSGLFKLTRLSRIIALRSSFFAVPINRINSGWK